MVYTEEEFKNNEKTKYVLYPSYQDLLRKEEEANLLLQDEEMKEIAEEELKKPFTSKRKSFKKR